MQSNHYMGTRPVAEATHWWVPEDLRGLLDKEDPEPVAPGSRWFAIMEFPQLPLDKNQFWSSNIKIMALTSIISWTWRRSHGEKGSRQMDETGDGNSCGVMAALPKDVCCHLHSPVHSITRSPPAGYLWMFCIHQRSPIIGTRRGCIHQQREHQHKNGRRNAHSDGVQGGRIAQIWGSP